MTSSDHLSVTACPAVGWVGRDADRSVVWLAGEHDISTVADLSAILARANCVASPISSIPARGSFAGAVHRGGERVTSLANREASRS